MFRLDLGKYSTNGGSLSPSLAAILYQTALGDFVYQTDSNGNVVLDNQGTLTSAYDGLPYSSRFIELGALNDVDIPIHHTLGSNIQSGAIYTSGGATDTTISPVANGYNISHVYVSAPLPYIVVPGTTLVSNTKVLFTFTYTGTSGTPPIFDRYFNGTSFVDITPSHQVVDGINTIELATSNSNVYVTLDATSQVTSFNGDFTFNTIQQITNPNSYLTYYDFTDGLVTLGNSVDGGSSKELVDTASDALSWNIYGTNTVANDTDGSIVVTYVDNSLGAYINLTQAGGLSENLIIGKSYLVDFSAKINTGAATIRVYDGVFRDTALSTTIYQNFSVYIKVTASGQYINIPNMSVGEAVNIKDISVKEILPISTKYTLNTKTVNNFLSHTTPWSISDWARINNNPNLIGKLALETLGATKTIPELDMVMDAGASADKWFPCMEAE